jgi:predicted phosphohydrolase
MYIWAADLHLDTVMVPIKSFATQWGENDAEGLLLTGDIATSKCLKEKLEELHHYLKKPIYYVLGNHDFWYSSFKEMDEHNLGLKDVNYIHNKVLKLGNFNLVGNNGWYDAGFGNLDNDALMKDFFLIKDFKCKDYLPIVKERAEYLVNQLEDQIKDLDNILVLTHVPMIESFAIATDIPEWYGCKMLTDMFDKYKDKKGVVLSGHTHFASKVLFNQLECYSGEARRGCPVLCGLVYEDSMKIEPI